MGMREYICGIDVIDGVMQDAVDAVAERKCAEITRNTAKVKAAGKDKDKAEKDDANLKTLVQSEASGNKNARDKITAILAIKDKRLDG